MNSEVSDFYRRMLDASAEKSAPSPLISEYDQALLAAAPNGMAVSSFGCGDPLAFAEAPLGGTVLDLGCGAGLDLIAAARKVGPDGRVIGVDMMPEMIARARENAARAGLSTIDVVEGMIEDAPVESGSVDLIVSNCVVNLSGDKPAVFREIARLLRPGGGFAIADLCADDLPEWINAHKDLYAACLSSVSSEAEYIELARGAGLIDVRIADRMVYDAGQVEQLIRDELPVALDAIAARIGCDADDAAPMIGAALAGSVRSVKLVGRKPGP
ncbi:MAG: methyltransferase domain-containing protein [Pseudomonadota bacterium]